MFVKEKSKEREKHIIRARDGLMWVLHQNSFKCTELLCFVFTSASHSPSGASGGSPCSKDEAQQSNTTQESLPQVTLAISTASYYTVPSPIKCPITTALHSELVNHVQFP